MFGFPEDLKSYFFHKSVNDIKDLNSVLILKIQLIAQKTWYILMRA